MIGSRLFREYVLPDDSHDGISRRVWAGTPWITDAWVGQGNDRRRDRVIRWCVEHLGEPAWPFSNPPRPGRWREGNATVFGWTWFGFDTEDAMREFEALWGFQTQEEKTNGSAGGGP